MEVYRPTNEGKKRKKKALQAWFKVKREARSSGAPEAKLKIKMSKQGRESEANASGDHLATATSRNHHPVQGRYGVSW
jgi:hypothetical protein